MRRELDKQLARTSEATGRELVWTAQESEIIGMICDQIDRRVRILKQWEACADDDPKVACKLSSEARLLEQATARLLKNIKTELPGPESLTTIKARRAVNARWDRVRAAGR